MKNDTIEEELVRKWRNQHVHRSTGQNFGAEWILEHAPSGQLTADLIYRLHAATPRGTCLDWITAKDICSFTSDLARQRSVTSVLDAFCGCGLLLAAVADATAPEHVRGLDIHGDALKLAAAIAPGEHYFEEADGFVTAPTVDARGGELYDLVVLHPPFGSKLNREQAEATALPDGMETSQAALLTSTRFLADGGRLLAVVPAYTFGRRGSAGLRRRLAAKGCRLSAAFHLPPGSFSGTGTAGYLVVVEAGEPGKLFVGEMRSAAEDRATLLENFERGRGGPEPALGREVDSETFVSWQALEAADRVRRMARKAGWERVPASVALHGWDLVAPDRAVAQTGSLFLATEGSPSGRDGDGLFSVSADPQLLNLKRRSALRPARRPPRLLELRVNEERINPAYLSLCLTRTSIGRAILETLRGGGFLPNVSKEALATTVFYLPPRDRQEQVMDALDKVQAARTVASELEAELLEAPETISTLADRAERMCRAEDLTEWVDTLPFPMAAVLWRFLAQNAVGGGPAESLLHFFEAAAAFFATVHLSAWRSNSAAWLEEANGLHGALAQANQTLDRPTFGTWNTVNERLGAAAASLAGPGKREQRAAMYGTPDDDVHDMLCSTTIRKVLQEACSIRNRTSGHGGLQGEGAEKEARAKLMGLLTRFRHATGRSWVRYPLILPAECERSTGGTYLQTAFVAVGNRSPFRTGVFEPQDGLARGCLHQVDATARTSLRLLPFVQVAEASSESAQMCLIYSRRERDGQCLVSYDRELDKPRIVQQPQLEEALASVMPSA